jgi:hypothetical protein
MMQKCCFKDCERRGEPQKGFEFYACEECLTKLESEIKRRMEITDPRPLKFGPGLIQ